MTRTYSVFHLLAPRIFTAWIVATPTPATQLHASLRLQLPLGGLPQLSFCLRHYPHQLFLIAPRQPPPLRRTLPYRFSATRPQRLTQSTHTWFCFRTYLLFLSAPPLLYCFQILKSAPPYQNNQYPTVRSPFCETQPIARVGKPCRAIMFYSVLVGEQCNVNKPLANVVIH